MQTGILWFDSRDIPLPQKIKYALQCYEKKYGKPPSLVELSLNEGSAEGLDITIEHSKSILPHHMLIGVKDE